MRILVVEDDPDLAATVGDFLELRGHTVDFGSNGRQGLELAGAHAFDAIVLDRLLPGKVTALDTVQQCVEGLGAGADDYLVKPFAMVELVARLEALHRRAHRRVASSPLRCADLEYDPATLTTTRAGQTLELSATLRKLLEHLLRHQDRVVTRAELCDLLWGEPDVDALRGQIHELRRIVDRPFEQRLLHTVRGGGWRLLDRGK
jgi:DNA-binding response OmpR family regulator